MKNRTLKMIAAALVVAICGSAQAALEYKFTITNSTNAVSKPIMLDFQKKQGVKLAPNGVKPGQTLNQSYTASFGTGKSKGTANAWGCLTKVYEVGTPRIWEAVITKTAKGTDWCELNFEIEIIPMDEDEDKPAAGEDDEDKPAAGQDDEDMPAAGEDDEDKPTAGQDDEDKPAAGEDDEDKPAAGEDDEDKSDAKSDDADEPAEASEPAEAGESEEGE